VQCNNGQCEVDCSQQLVTSASLANDLFQALHS